jgi:hypothetical protein
MGEQFLALDTIVKRKVNPPSFKVDDSLIFLDSEGGYCYSLNTTGARIWELIAEPTSIEAVCNSLCREFKVDRETCEREVNGVISSLREADLVV